jgi:hypothetical protein
VPSERIEVTVNSVAGEFVYSASVSPASVHDCLWYAWDDAQEECDRAYALWHRDGSPMSYAVYGAALDRVDAAQDALALHHRELEHPHVVKQPPHRRQR